MQITLYSGFSKEANSTKRPSGGTAVNCVLKENTSVVHPVFILESANFGINYLSWGNRYYFVDDIVAITNTMLELHCTVDVLATYKDSIGSSSQYVVRSASQSDPYCIDMLYPTQNKCSTALTQISGLNIVSGAGTYVVGIITGTGQGVTYYSMTQATFTNFMAFLFGGSWLDAPVTEVSAELQRELVNPFQYIASVQWYPFITIGGTSEYIKFGYWTSTVIAEKISSGNRVKTFTTSVTLPTHPQAGVRGAYLNGSPYTRRLVHLYVWGSFPLDATYYVENQTFAINIKVDVFTGVGVLQVTDPEGYAIHKASAQCGVPLQISQVTQNLIQTSMGVIGMIGSAVSGNLMGYTSGIANAIESLSPQVQTEGAQGSNVGWEIAPYIVSTFYPLVEEDNTHNGRPLMQRKTISSLSGYIKVENPDVDIVGTVYEKDQIVNYMAGGFYYE